ncbi:MIP/aquaporin family protein [Mycoplasmopsis ciconiae]|uniref:MIP/aquaporin family protein n=1 Tax=Mycoplasmopsis ciconiae TaxID=561067 RepID=A0ABU7MKS4_9BACT|nr:MIP/aquaporin family protein [Mycoplasmopsis ciconiae]
MFSKELLAEFASGGGAPLGLLFLSELVGTFFLILLGNGVNASNSFKNMFAKKTGGNWVVIILGWGFAVMAGIIAALAISNFAGAHLNPAVTMFAFISALVDKANVGTTSGALLFGFAIVYIIAQFLGAMIAQTLLNVMNWQHIKENELAVLKGTSCTGPSHRNAWFNNGLYEFMGTFVLLFIILAVSKNANAGGSFQGTILPVVFIVMSIGLSLGSATGYAINPARDLGPRIIYFATAKLYGKKLINPVSADFTYGLLIPGLMPMLAGIVVGFISFAFYQ